MCSGLSPFVMDCCIVLTIDVILQALQHHTNELLCVAFFITGTRLREFLSAQSDTKAQPREY